MMDDVERIARGLTEEMRLAVLGGAQAGIYGIAQCVRDGLLYAHLGQNRIGLTELGERVRTYLQENPGNA